VAAVLNEAASSASPGAAAWGIEVDEEAFPVLPEVRTAAALLGLSPLEVANEGVLVAVVDAGVEAAALEILRAHPLGRHAAAVGTVTTSRPGTVVLRTGIGGRRILDFPRGLLLPRIC
jgi:hydrogenase expression/formation protein HypE